MNLDKIDYTEELQLFNPEGGTVCPYLKFKLDNGIYQLFEGAIGPNRFQYFSVPENSTAGKACAEFIEKYYTQNHKRHDYFNEGTVLLELCLSDSVEYLQGADAYKKYWNLVLTETDKKRLNFYIIPFFEHLAEWFTIQLAYNTSEQSSNSDSAPILHAQKKQWIKKVHSEVVQFIETSKKTSSRTSFISASHAKELLHFRDWLFTFINPSNNQLSLEDFIGDFGEGNTYVDTSTQSTTGEIDIFYSVNQRRYTIDVFWIFLKNYHLQRAFDKDSYQDRLTYLNRIVYQLTLVRDENYEHLITKNGVPNILALKVKNAANNVIANVEIHIKDLNRYFAEQKAKQEKIKNERPSQNSIEKIIAAIDHAGKIIHQSPSLHLNKDEEGIRDAFLFRLYAIEDDSIVASGESFNKEGRTDICVKTVGGVTIFIGECKIWKGKNNFFAALTQLIDRYVDWYLEQGALLIFVRRADFSKTLNLIKSNVKDHTYCIGIIKEHSPTHLSVLFRQRDDHDKHVRIEIMAFHFPVTD